MERGQPLRAADASISTSGDEFTNTLPTSVDAGGHSCSMGCQVTLLTSSPAREPQDL